MYSVITRVVTFRLHGCCRLPATAVSVGTIGYKRMAHSQRLSLTEELTGDAGGCNLSLSSCYDYRSILAQIGMVLEQNRQYTNCTPCILSPVWFFSSHAQLHWQYHAVCVVRLTVTAQWNQHLWWNVSAVLPPHQAHGIAAGAQQPWTCNDWHENDEPRPPFLLASDNCMLVLMYDQFSVTRFHSFRTKPFTDWNMMSCAQNTFPCVTTREDCENLRVTICHIPYPHDFKG